jgi:hypothetical protein
MDCVAYKTLCRIACDLQTFLQEFAQNGRTATEWIPPPGLTDKHWTDAPSKFLLDVVKVIMTANICLAPIID